ncbi:MAG: response regulator [Spirochaetota bacterium]
MKEKILVIDDDSHIRDMLSEMLQDSGYQVVTAENGYEGIKEYHRDDFQLIIMDILMPEKEGIETYRELKQADSDVKVIAISGGGQIGAEQYLRMIRYFGVQYTFEKPVEKNKLLSTIESIIGQ